MVHLMGGPGERTNLANTAVQTAAQLAAPAGGDRRVDRWRQKFSPQILAEMDEEALRVQQAISSLPLSQRVVVVLYYINDLSLQEISDILGIPEGTVKSRLHYGRQALKKQLGVGSEAILEMQYEFTGGTITVTLSGNILKGWAAQQPLPALGRLHLLRAASLPIHQLNRSRQFRFAEIPNSLFAWATVYCMDGRMSTLRLIS